MARRDNGVAPPRRTPLDPALESGDHSDDGDCGHGDGRARSGIQVALMPH
jgi:hypothetical protein